MRPLCACGSVVSADVCTYVRTLHVHFVHHVPLCLGMYVCMCVGTIVTLNVYCSVVSTDLR